MKKLVASSVSMALGFLVIVVVYGKVKSIMFEANGSADLDYSTSQLVLGGLGESIRAVLTTWLYRYHQTNKSRLANALLFGLICSALIGSIWLLVGVELIDAHYKLSFIIDDGIILLLQGLISGVVLWLVYRKEERSDYQQTAS